MNLFLKRFLFTSLFLLSGCFIASGQINRAVFENLFTELESQTLYVNTIFHDSRGFMWLGTEEGLIRYDGVSYLYYLPKIDDPFSISDKRISAICEDQAGNLWVGTRNGLDRFDYFSNSFEKFFNEPSNPASLSNNEVYSLSCDKTGNLWIGTATGLNKLVTVAGKSTGHHFEHFLNDPTNTESLSGNTIWSICTDSSNNTWIGTNEGLNLVQSTARGKISFRRFLNVPADPFSISKTTY